MLLKDEIVTENGQQYLKITVHGIAKPEETPKAIHKEDNKISIATTQGSISIEQSNNGTITLDAQRQVNTRRSKQQCRETRTWSDKQLGEINFNEVTDFSITCQGNKAAIILRLPLKSITQTYSFEPGAATDHAESATPAAVSDAVPSDK